MDIRENRLTYFRDVEHVNPKIFYHYTSLDALFNIVTSKTFRLTSLRSSNDKKELSYSCDEFLTTFRSIFENELDANARQCFQKMINSVDEDPLIFNKECKINRASYALCLSNKRDNLTHWDRYAANCAGVCIGFNAAAINILLRRTDNSIFGTSLFEIAKALYTKEQIAQDIKNSITYFANILPKRANSTGEINLYELIEKNSFAFMVSMYRKVKKFRKNGSFVDEDEVRLYYEAESIPDTREFIKSICKNLDNEGDHFSKSFDALVKDLKIDEEHFMISRLGIRSYHDLCLDKIWGSGLIPEIILGPMCVQNRAELLCFLRDNGLGDTKVSSSKVPIR